MDMHATLVDRAPGVFAGSIAIALLSIAFVRERFARLRDSRDAIETDRIRSLADMSLESIFVLDSEGRVVDLNQQARVAFGISVGDDLRAAMPAVGAAIEEGRASVECILTGYKGDFPAKAYIQDVVHLGVPVRTVNVRDLTERAAAERRIEHMATHDPLTGLANRAHLVERLTEALAKGRRDGTRTALLYLDLDGFKPVNDVYGHARGDLLLREIAALLRQTVRETDTVARIGGDEFAIVQRDSDQPAAAEALAARIVADMAAAFASGDSDVAVGVSVGIAVAPEDADDPDSLLGNADVALYRAKAEGRGVWRFYEPTMDDEQRNRRRLDAELRLAIPHGQMSLVYQPQLDPGTGMITGFEAFARWTHPELGEVPPSVFIPAAEASGYILTLGAWLLEEACLEAAGWRRELRIAVNLSPVQILQKGLPARVREILARTGLPASRLEIEVPETILSGDRRNAAACLAKLQEMGVGIAIGDFGTGCALNGAATFPFDRVKIGRAVLGGLAADPRGPAVMRALIDLGRGLDLTVVAEGIETEGHFDIATQKDGVEIQGYYVGRPAPIDAFRSIVGLDPDGDEKGSVAA